MFKKFLLLSLLVSSLSFAQKASAITLGETINYFDVGYRVGVSPLLWPVIPAMAAGYYLPKKNKTEAYILGAAGLTTGLAVIALAVYGAKKLIEKQLTK